MTQQKNLQGQNKKKRPFIESGMMATLILLLFRIPLANIIGDEGNGYLAVSWELYVLFSFIFVYGISHVNSKMVRSRIGKKQYHNSARVLGTTILIGILTSLISAVVIYFISDILLQSVFNMKLSGISFRIFGVLLIINGIVGCFRGYFEGAGSRIPSMFSRIVEAIITATGSLIFAIILRNYGEKVGNLLLNEQFKPAFAAGGVVIGYLCGSIFAFLFLMLVYRVYQRQFKKLLKKDETRVLENRGSIIKEMYVSLFFVVGQALFIKIYRLVNIVIYSKIYIQGEDMVKHIQYLGSYYGKITVLMAIMIVLILIFCNQNTRRIRKSIARNEFRNGKQILADDLKRIFSIGLPATASFLILGQNFLQTLFRSAGQTEGLMLKLSGITVLMISIAVYLYKMMLDLKMQKSLFIIQVVAFAIQTIVMAVLVKVPAMGPLSLIIAELVFWGILAAAQLIVMIKTYQIRFTWSNLLVVPLVGSLFMAGGEYAVLYLAKDKISSWILCILALAIGIVLYLLSRKLPLFNKE